MSKKSNELLAKKIIEGMKPVKTKKGKLLIWMCKSCKWVTVSDQSYHRLDYCKCFENTKGNQGVYVDYEEYGLRYGGCLPNMKFIAIIDADKAQLNEVWVEDVTAKHLTYCKRTRKRK